MLDTAPVGFNLRSIVATWECLGETVSRGWEALERCFSSKSTINCRGSPGGLEALERCLCSNLRSIVEAAQGFGSIGKQLLVEISDRSIFRGWEALLVQISDQL